MVAPLLPAKVAEPVTLPDRTMGWAVASATAVATAQVPRDVMTFVAFSAEAAVMRPCESTWILE